MERSMSVEDKIRRAEEIYYRRQNREIPTKETVLKTKTGKKNIKLFRKMIKQIIICLIIYGIFYLIINSNYIFSEDFTNKAKEILSQDINFSEVYSVISNKINEIIQNVNSTEQDGNKSDESQEANLTEQGENKTDESQDGDLTEKEEKTKEEIQNNEENIGGADELPTIEEQNVENTENGVGEATPTEETQTLSQMEQDANYIKNTINFIKPVNGTISSMFGLRNPTTASVPKNHTGTDIAAVTGTKIVSATDGTVILTSSKGDFGKHMQIQINDVIVLYAHCNELYVKEGDTITQGQEIGEVGSTGNTTGPHLHFEIRYQNRRVDPQLIVEL